MCRLGQTEAARLLARGGQGRARAAGSSEGTPQDRSEPGYWSRAFEALRHAAGPDTWGEDPVAAIIRFRRGDGA